MQCRTIPCQPPLPNMGFRIVYQAPTSVGTYGSMLVCMVAESLISLEIKSNVYSTGPKQKKSIVILTILLYQ